MAVVVSVLEVGRILFKSPFYSGMSREERKELIFRNYMLMIQNLQEKKNEVLNRDRTEK